MPANYVLLEKITVGAAGASSVTFNSIPQSGYTDLCIKISARGNAAQIYEYPFKIRFNGATTDTNLTSKGLEGNGSAASSYPNSFIYLNAANGGSSTSNTFSNIEVYIPNYTSSNYKSVSVDGLLENNATTAYMSFQAGLWSNTSAITSISIIDGGGTLQQYSTFSLYGIAALGTTPAIAPKATGGDIIQTDGTYWYHAFLSSGTFTPVKGLTCDVLQVAGGAGGGRRGGGGGAGGISYLTSQIVATSAQTVTVGAGGAGATVTTNKGTNGNNSQFASITAAVGGGGGGSVDNRIGGNGGSGGGGMVGSAGGTGTSGQGNNGGTNSSTGGQDTGSGGGGAGAVGGAGTTTLAGAGGDGVNTYSSWLSTVGQIGVSGYIAGGGGGSGNTVFGTASAGGGNGGNSGVGGNGNSNTGGGGGGGANMFNGGSAGSGFVIVRYAI